MNTIRAEELFSGNSVNSILSDFTEKESKAASCSSTYINSARPFQGCVPERCGVLALAGFVSGAQMEALSSLAQRTVGSAVPNGTAAFYDVASGAITNAVRIWTVLTEHLVILVNRLPI